MNKADLLKKMEDLDKESNAELLKRTRPGSNGAVEDELGVLVTDLLVGAAEQVRKTSGGIAPEGPDLSSVESSIQKYQDHLRGRAESE